MLDDAKECLFTEILPVIDKKISLVENGKRAAAVTVRNAYRAQITTSITEHYVGGAHKKEELILTNMTWLLARWMQLARVTEAMGDYR